VCVYSLANVALGKAMSNFDFESWTLTDEWYVFGCVGNGVISVQFYFLKRDEEYEDEYEPEPLEELVM
jgi:hypothetical protein